MNLVEKTIVNMLRERPYYAHFFLSSSVDYDSKIVPTAGVRATDKGVKFLFNKEFTDSLTSGELSGLIEHETLHVLMDHVFDTPKGLDPKWANIARDCAINQLIPELPSGAIYPAGLGAILGKKLLHNQSWIYYYNQIENFVQNGGTLPEGLVEIDSHEWEASELSDSQKALAKAKVQAISDQALKQAKGNVPMGILSLLNNRPEAQISWKTILANFLARSRSSIKIPTRKRINRRFGFTAPGFKVKRELVVAVCADSSGSVSDSAYTQFVAEIERMVPLCSKIHWIDADCVVQNVTTLKKKKPEYKRKGSGGTAYQPAIDKAMEFKPDVIVYFGDFDCADQPNDPKVPFLWVGVGESPAPANFGSVVRINA